MGTIRLNPETRQHATQHLDQILRKAIEKKASDIHLKAGLPAVVRVNGQLYYLGEEGDGSVARLNPQEINEIAYSLMNTRQIERFESGLEVDLGYETPKGRFRINICQQRSNPRLVCRYIPDVIPKISELGLPSVVEQICSTKRGLVVVTGATGSGKSTTIASMIDHITRSRSCHIVTIEDPIEFIFKDRKSIITQREIGLDTPNFSQALKYSLRQDPDVILVGEMRDEETIIMALTAAETGHLVFSTLHTLDASETINRIVGSVSSVGLQTQIRHQLSSVLVAAISQRLIRSKENKSRVPAIEVLIANTRVKSYILDSTKTSGELRQIIEQSQSVGMQSFDQSLMDLVQGGKISKEEALNHCSNPQDFQLRLQGVVAGKWRDDEMSGSFPKGQAPSGVDRNESLSAILELDSQAIVREKK